MNIFLVAMANAKENSESGCFAAILRHLQCWHGTSTHLGSDRIAPIGRYPKGEAKLGGGKDEFSSTSSSGRRAGVVARLMGIETLPDAKWVPALKSPDLFLRSRSVNFMDYLLEVNISSQQARQHPHRRVRTSVSFCQGPVKVLTSVPEPKENKFVVFLMENHDEPARTEMKMQRKSRKNEVQRKKKKKKTSDCCRDEPRTRSQAGCNSESRRPNNVRAAHEKKCGGTYGNMRKSQGRDVECGDSPDSTRPVSICDQLKYRPQEGRTVDFTAVQAARILDPVIVCKKKAAMKKKKKEVIEFSESGKQMDDAVKKAHELAGAEEGKSYQFSPGSSELEEICVMIEGHVLDCLLEEFFTV